MMVNNFFREIESSTFLYWLHNLVTYRFIENMLVNLMQAEDMILHLKEMFLKMLEEAAWLDEATRAKARQKVT